MLYILLFSTIVALVFTGIQLYLDYRSDIKRIDQNIQQTFENFSGSISNSLWQVDDKELQLHLNGMVKSSHIAYVTVVTNYGHELSSGKMPLGDKKSHTFPILHSSMAGSKHSNWLGDITLTASLKPAYDALWTRAIFILVSQLLKILLIALFVMLIVRHLITRHLEAMARYARGIQVASPVEPLKLKRNSPHNSDELSDVVHALNQMRIRVAAETERLKRSEAKSREERDQAIQANNAKSLFLANMSHELRTPMNGVMGYASLLLDTQLDNEQRDFVHTIQGSAETLLGIVNDILDISRIESGKLMIDPIPFDLRMVIGDVVELLGKKAEAKGIALETRISPELPSMLLGDAVRIRQILNNLAANAIKFTNQGYVLINVEVVKQSIKSLQLRIAIEDTGVGIGEEDQKHIFEEYNQVDSSTTRNYGGSGLGLTISKQLVDLMGGELGVESTLGKGSTFWVSIQFPLYREQGTIHGQGRVSLEGIRILLLDSYELSRKISLELFGQWGVLFDSVRTAGEALHLLSVAEDTDYPYDVIILDDFMSDMDGLDFCEIIRSKPFCENTLLLILSSHPQRGDAGRYRMASVNGFLSKQLRDRHLKTMLHQMLEDKQNGLKNMVTRFSLEGNTEERRGNKGHLTNKNSVKVLLVEDNLVNQKLAVKMLDKLGCDVTIANNGKEAIEYWQNNNFQMIFMDCMMPVMDGYDATREIRQQETISGLEKTPIIALTANAMEGEKGRCEAAGMDEFITKPVKSEKLRSAVNTYMLH
jgi:signal transduction histidine kinase/CheY-like chemotaxis protein